MNESGDATLWNLETLPAPPGVFPHGLLVANVTDADGNSGEFSNQFVYLPEPGLAGGLASGLLLLLRGLGRRRLERRTASR